MAEIKGCEGVIALMKQIYEVLQEYEKQTDAMSNADLETLQQALFNRNELIGRLEELKQQVEGVIELELSEERQLLNDLVHGQLRWYCAGRTAQGTTAYPAEHHRDKAAYR